MSQIKQIQENQKTQETVSEQLVTKFDNDRELVEKFVEHGYSISQLEESIITHPSPTDPMCTLANGKVAGFWL